MNYLALLPSADGEIEALERKVIELHSEIASIKKNMKEQQACNEEAACVITASDKFKEEYKQRMNDLEEQQKIIAYRNSTACLSRGPTHHLMDGIGLCRARRPQSLQDPWPEGSNMKGRTKGCQQGS